MIAPQELRQNNLIRDIESGRIGAVLTIGEKKCTIKMPYSKLSQSYEEFEPIELTEHWLLKFGFEHTTPDGWLCLNICNYWTFLYWQKGLLELSVNRHSVVLQKILYVHQLQNIFFDFTGEELKIKE
ncbi:hypothetical protein ABE425_14740 [Chryseobacterium cucumeris]|uniref:hypothetical protein n=1 Tax=Chryseobacterium TaxID=59732 RepID=UPI00288341F2|nr:hypothetical protein [Chryseobacterium sp. SG20098]WNI34741.1 hypothetical protein RHP76_12205 [Chryseobacterium sp. SG20098]